MSGAAAMLREGIGTIAASYERCEDHMTGADRRRSALRCSGRIAIMDQVLLPETARREERRNFTDPFTLPGQ